MNFTECKLYLHRPDFKKYILYMSWKGAVVHRRARVLWGLGPTKPREPCLWCVPLRCPGAVCTWQWAGGRSGLLPRPSAPPAPSRCAGVSAGQTVPLRPVLHFLPWFVTVYNRPAEVTCLLDSPDHNRQEASLCPSRFTLNRVFHFLFIRDWESQRAFQSLC